MNRRGFFKAIGTAVLGAAIALRTPLESPLRLLSDGLRWPETVRRGDVFVIEGVYAVNPMTFAESERLQRFVAMQDVEAGELVEAEIVTPAIIPDGCWKNVSREPADNARIGFVMWDGSTKWRING